MPDVQHKVWLVAWTFFRQLRRSLLLSFNTILGSLACEGQRASLIAHQALEVFVFKQACGERMEGDNKTPAILVKMGLL